MSTNEPITVAELIEKSGGIVKMGRELGIRYNSIYNWKQVPAERVLAVSRLTGVPKEQIRPDIYQ